MKEPALETFLNDFCRSGVQLSADATMGINRCDVRKVKKELADRGMAFGSCDDGECRERLKMRLIEERELKGLEKYVEDARFTDEDPEHFWTDVLSQAYCDLHMPIRLNETVYNAIRSEISQRNLSARVEGEVLERFDNHVREFAKFANSWGHRTVVGKGRELEFQRFPHAMSKRIFSTASLEAGDLDLLLDIALGVGRASPRWVKLRHFLTNYISSFTILMRKADAYAPGELERFQVHTDRAFLAWRDLYGGKHITNYMHVWACHVAEYSRHHGKTWHLRNEGWEALNWDLKHRLHKFINRKGFKRVKLDDGNILNTKVEEAECLGNWLARVATFQTTWSEEFLAGGGDLNKGLQYDATENKWVLDESCTELDGDDAYEPSWSDEEEDGDDEGDGVYMGSAEQTRTSKKRRGKGSQTVIELDIDDLIAENEETGALIPKRLRYE